MPDRSSSVVSYAAGASLAAVALIYVFGPTFTIDNEAGSSRRRTIVGLRNQANDCFINSVLQALAGLGELRIYLIRETHRRRIENPSVYANLVQPPGKEMAQWKLQGLQEGLVTQGLKEMLDALNERPLSKKAISPFGFVRVLEVAFKQRISRQQQDAQEFLQIVAERLKDEYHAGQRARLRARSPSNQSSSESQKNGNGVRSVDGVALDEKHTEDDADTAIGSDGHSGPGGRDIPEILSPLELEEGFPMEGKYESHLECQTCRYRSKPREETFCTITLAVPQVSSTTLNSCFDGIFKTEFIDDFKCEMCRLLLAKTNLEHEMSRATSEKFRAKAHEDIEKLRFAIETDPENPPPDVDLGDIRYAPKRKIAKTTRMSIFPSILAIHLSRSIYGAGQMTQKNSAKVSFPETLPLGGLADQKQYKLIGLVCHRGGHNSGHYEAFRRQNQPVHFPNSNTFQASDVYSKTPTPISTPEISARLRDASPAISTPDLLSPSSATSSSVPSLDSTTAHPRSIPPELATLRDSLSNGKDVETTSLRSVTASTRSAIARLTSPKNGQDGSMLSAPRKADELAMAKRYRKRRPADKWWRVSDEKVRESKTNEVMGMQREVYLLFYELEKDL